MHFWEWFGLITGIIGVVAFLMAIQPFTQFIWGRPKIEIEFSLRDINASRYLDIFLFNRPVKGRFLKMIKVRRDKAEDVSIMCNIENIQTHKVYTDMLFPKIATISQEEYSVSLPGSKTPASVTLMRAFGDGKVIINDNSNNAILVPGKYCLTITVHCSEIEFIKRVYFFVGTKSYEFCFDAINSS